MVRPLRATEGPAALGIATLALLLAAGLLGMVVVRAEAQVTEAGQRARWVEVIAAVHDVSGALADEANEVALLAVEDPAATAPSGAAVARLAAVRAVAVADAEEWLHSVTEDPVVGPTAASLLDLLSFVPLEPEEVTPPEDARDVVEEAQLVLASALAADRTLLGLAQVGASAVLPRLVAADAVDVAFVDRGRAAPWVGSYFSDADDYIRSGDGGWLGTDAALPSPFLDHEAARDDAPDAWAALGAAFDGAEDLSTVQAFDRWVRTWPSPSGPQPATAREVLGAAAVVAADVDAAVDAVLVAEEADALGIARSAERRRATALVAGTVLLPVLLVVVVHLARRQRGRIAGLRDAALVDGLTGLANRRALEAHAARRDDRDDAHALLLFDLDHFKGINDRFGHAIGDTALQRVAEVARQVASTADAALAARLGGDEFVVLAHGLPDPGPAGGRLAQALVDGVRSVALATPEGPVHLSVSVGVGTAVGPLDLEDLLMKADIALYEVKRSGRGAHRTFSGTT